MTAFPSLASEHQGALGRGAGVLEPVREQIGLAELHEAHRLEPCKPGRLVSCQGLLQERQPFADASRPRVYVPKGRHDDRMH